MFNINITHTGDMETGNFVVTVRAVGQHVVAQSCQHLTAAQRHAAFEKAMAYANGFADAVKAVRSHIETRVDPDDLVRLAQADFI